MSSREKVGLIQRFVGGINRGDLSVVDETVDRDFFHHVPAAAEETAPDVLRLLLGDLKSAFPDLMVSVADLAAEEDTITLNVTLSGTRSGELWGAPGGSGYVSWTSAVRCRFTDGRFAFEWVNVSMPDVLQALRAVGLVPPPEEMDKPPKHPISLPEFLLKLVFSGQAADKPCTHQDMIRVVEPMANVCQPCVALGDVWPALRMCLVCGFVGCCDTSKNKHMKQHYQETGHPIFRSIRLAESWVWCYEDDAFFSGRILDKYR